MKSARSWTHFSWWALLGILALFGSISSTISSLFVNLIAIALLPVLFVPDALQRLRQEVLLTISVVVVLVLAVSFAFTAEQPSHILPAFNFISFLLAIPVYLIGRELSGSKTISIVLLLCLGGAFVSVGIGLYDLNVRGFVRSEGYLTGALIIARLGLLFGFVSSAGFFVFSDARRYLFCLGPVLGLVAALLASSRGALMAVPALAFLLLVFLVFDRRLKYRWWIAGGFIIVGLGVASLAYFAVGTSRIETMLAASLSVLSSGEALDSSTQQRLDFYSAGWTLFQQSPWFGYGWADIPRVAFTILDEKNYGGAYTLSFFHFHNDFLNFAVAAGVIGIGALIALMLAPIISALKSPRDAMFFPRFYAVSTIVLLYVLSGLTDITLGYDMPTTAYAMMCAIVLSVFREPDKKSS